MEVSYNNMDNISFDELKPLREKKADEYQPDEEELLEYAEYLGVELPGEEYMMGLLKEGITAQLPLEWQACQTRDGQLLYRNLNTRVVQEQHPLDEMYRQKVIQLRQYAQGMLNQQSLDAITEKSDEDPSLSANQSVLQPKSSLKALKEEQNKSQLRLTPFLQSKTITIIDRSPSPVLSVQKQSLDILKKQMSEKKIQLELHELNKQKQTKQQMLIYLKQLNQMKMQKIKQKLRKKKKKARKQRNDGIDERMLPLIPNDQYFEN